MSSYRKFKKSRFFYRGTKVRTKSIDKDVPQNVRRSYCILKCVYKIDEIIVEDDLSNFMLGYSS